MKILIAPDKFKGSLSAREVSDNISIGVRKTLPAAKIDIVAMADGGEGTAEVISDGLGAAWIRCRAHDPFGRQIEARYGWVEKSKTAVMEMSEAAGMRRLKGNELNPLIATTFGVGEMILSAARQGAHQIILGLGGSATNDGGVGMARAVRFRFLCKLDGFKPSSLQRDQRQAPGAETEDDGLKPSSLSGKPGERSIGETEHDGLKPSCLERLERIERPVDLKLPEIVAAVDVQNPLLGENGATRVFGPQKGITPEQIGQFEAGLTRLADVVARQFGLDYRNEPGAGAAGGLGFGLMSFCGATVRPGFDVVAEAVDLESKVRDADVVITGEGSLDRQTLEGKTPAGMAKIARKLGKRVYAIVGRADENQEVRKLFDGVFELRGEIPQAAELLQQRAAELARSL